MINCDVAIIGYAVNSTSGGFTNRNVKYVDTVGIKYLYSHFYGTYCAEPVAFLQLAAELRNRNINTYILDGLLMGFNLSEMKEKLSDINTNIYCFSLYESSKTDVLELMHYVKSINPQAIIVTGGPYVTLCYKELIESESIIDFITIGDGDFVLPELVRHLLNGDSINNIPNLVYRNRNGVATQDVPAKAVDMNELHPLERDFADIIFDKGFSLSIVSSRGCGHAVCSFCYLKQYQTNGNQPKFRFRSPKLVVEEIKQLINQYHIKKLTFVDDDFFGTHSDGMKRAQEFFELIIQEQIKLRFYMNVRVASVKYLIDHDLLGLAAKAGVKYFFIGFESYNDDILKRYHKGITTNDIDDICFELEKHDILINPGMITFDTYILPYQVKRNVDLLRRIHYYDLFMFTRTLMDLPSETQKMKDNRIKKGAFADSHTEKLYYSLVYFRDSLYPIYGEVDKCLITDEIRNSVIDKHFEFFYKLYDLVIHDEYNSIETLSNMYVDNIKKILVPVSLK